MKRQFILPILFKEFRVQMRGARAALLITLYVGLLLLALRLSYNSVIARLDYGAPLVNAQIGQTLFTGLALAIQALTVFLAPATTLNAISGEHERRTFELLATTPFSALQLLIGKLIAGMAFLLLLLFAALPLFSIVLLFGGVDLTDLGRVAATIAITAVAGGLLGICCSAFTRQTYSATLFCYALLVALVGGTLFAANLRAALNPEGAAPAAYVVANPLSAIASALASARPPEAVTVGALSPTVVLSLLTRGVTSLVNGTLTVLPLYRGTWILYGAASLLMLWLSVHAVRPSQRWRPGLSDAILALLVLAYLAAAWLARDWWLAGLG